MRTGSRELLPAIPLAAGVGFLVSATNGVALLVTAGIAALVVAVIRVLWRPSRAEGLDLRFAMVAVGLGVLLSAWIGLRGPSAVPISDLPFLLAIPLVAFAVLRGLRLPLPAWLLYVAGGLIVAALLPIVFVVERPPRILEEQLEINLGPAASRSSDLAVLARVEYSLVVIPMLIGAVAGSWSRARVLADLWLASAAICALVGVLDRLAGTGISPALVGNLEGLQLGERATGLTAHPNYLGLFAAMAVPVGIVRSFQTAGIARAAASAASVILLLGIQLSGSRLGLGAAALGVALLFLLAPRFRGAIAIGGIALALVAVTSLLVLPSDEAALERIGGNPSTEDATQKRFEVIDEALDNGLEHPLTGIGFGRIFDSHSIPVQFLQAGGVVALAVLLLWSLGISRLGWMLTRDRRLPAQANELAAALLAALLAWLLSGVINPQMSERFLFVPAGLLLGLGLAAARLRRDAGRPPRLAFERRGPHPPARPRAYGRVPAATPPPAASAARVVRR